MEKDTIEAIKHGVDLVAFIRSKGIPLKKNGKSYFGLCPFHDDTNPSFSVNPTKNLWQCFGCGAGGDVIRFVELFDRVDFKEAVNRLSGIGDHGSDKTKRTGPRAQLTNRPTVVSARQLKLLSRVIEFYHTAFCEDSRAKEYLAARGINDNAAFSSFKVGFSNGTLINVLPAPEGPPGPDGDITHQLKELGILNDKGNEHFYGCVTFPLYDLAGNPCGMYGRRVNDMGRGDAPAHLYLSGPRHGLFNWQAAKAHKEIILTESIIDALTLYNAGIKHVIPCYGTNGLTEEHVTLFKKYEVDTIYICLDADETGRQATETATARLQAEGLRVHPLTLPDGQDINSFFSLTANASSRFKALLSQAKPDAAVAVKGDKEDFTATQYGFIATITGRKYEVRGITRSDAKLKATVKGVRVEKSRKRFHVDTVDFYSARSRAFLIKGLCDLFGEDQQSITEDMDRLLELAEGYKQPKERSTVKEEMTDADKQAALAFLKNPEMFSEIVSDFETIGYTGEETNKLLCYIAAVSRKMEEPLSVMIQSRSAAGKSFLQDTVLSLVPEQDYVKYTRLTDQALFYKETKSLAHKILAIEELDGMNGAIYSIRSIQSSKKITIAYTGKDPVTGELKTQDNTVEGPLMVFITTTDVEIDGETSSRFVFISIDESEEMTEKILKKQRQTHTMQGLICSLASSTVIKKHQNASRLLRPLHVINPYAELLTFTSKSLRARRDHTKYLNLILAICYLFQYQRKIRTMEHNGRSIEYVNATLGDIAKANEIAGEVLGRSLDELTPPSRNLLELIREMVRQRCKEKRIEPDSYHFTRRDIRQYSGWSDFQVKTHIRQLEELEYIYSVMGKKGKEYVYELLVTGEIKEDKPFLVGLVDTEQLKKKAKEQGIRDDLEG